MKNKMTLYSLVIALTLTACSSNTAPLATASSPPPTATKIPETPTPQPTGTPIPTPTLGAGSTTIGQDGATLVYIPAGEFFMGSKAAEDMLAQNDEYPQHTVYMDAYWIDQTEVTNEQYAKCVEAGVCKQPSKSSSNKVEDYFGNPEYDDFPVIHMNWDDANTYCTWAGRSLPTEAQWEKAARGTDGRIYPWGNEEPNADLLNYNNNIGETIKVGSFEAGKSPYGAYDMAGNVWEWVNDKYSQTYYSKSPAENPTGPAAGETYILRGGSYDVTKNTWIRAAERSQGIPPRWYYMYIGFRCATSNP